uniref:Uncharacterized protein n=1 Tax=Gossypium raimondii TaxID=29730 RepID=A0A0D2R9Y2_GOSRA|nr:hypothetical protein B456_004G279900 [Gossypium raimondii]
MASSIRLSLSPPSKTLAPPSTSTSRGCRCCSVVSVSKCHKPTRRKRQQVICMAPEEEKLIRRNPLDFPIILTLIYNFCGKITYNPCTWQLFHLGPLILLSTRVSELDRFFNLVLGYLWRRPDIFPQFSPMKTPLPAPMPYSPPQEDEEDEEDPEKEQEPENPEKQS